MQAVRHVISAKAVKFRIFRSLRNGAPLLVACLLLAMAGKSAAAQSDIFPALPPSRACPVGDMDGAWKLVRLYEVPEGAASLAYNNAPHQYLYFDPNQTYAELRGTKYYPEARELETALRRALKSPLRQYVLTDAGALYLYESGRSVGAYYCHLATRAQTPFLPGDMVLRTGAEAEGPRQMMIYRKVRFDNAPVQAAPAPVASPRRVSTPGATPSNTPRRAVSIPAPPPAPATQR